MRRAAPWVRAAVALPIVALLLTTPSAHGVWFVRRVVVDAQWRRSRNPDHDVAFLVFEPHDGTTMVRRLTGGERLGTGTVIGVIGGYEQGGYLASVSYSPRFGRAVRSLFRTAIADG